MQHFSENYWKKRLAKTVFLGEKGKWPENGRNGEKGKRNRMPGKGKRLTAPDPNSEPRHVPAMGQGMGVSGLALFGALKSWI